MNAVIEARSLARFYGQVVGINDVDARVGPGITGLLGPNGAGKSTFMRLVTGQLRPSRGELSVLGLRPFANPRLFRRMGFCPDRDALYDDMTALKFVTFMMRLHGLASGEARRRAERALERVGLGAAMTRRCGGYSKGMRQRAKLAQAIAHDPELLVLDEPLGGLDPIARTEVVGLLEELRAGGAHILVSSHVLHEVEELTQTILLIHRGRILAEGEVGEIRDLLDRHPRRVRLHVRDARALARELLLLEEVLSVSLEPGGGRLLLETTDVAALYRALPSCIARLRPGVRSLESIDSGLEAVFDYLVG